MIHVDREHSLPHSSKEGSVFEDIRWLGSVSKDNMKKKVIQRNNIPFEFESYLT